MKTSTKIILKVLICIGAFLFFNFIWWLSGYNFDERGPEESREFFMVCFGTAMVYYFIPYFTEIEK